jgi:hypothetical protein
MSSSHLPPSHPDQPEEIIDALPSTIPDEEIDKPQPELVIQVCLSQTKTYTDTQSRPAVDEELALSPVVLGCATFGYGIYQSKADIVSTLPVRIVRLALRAGITAFDTCMSIDSSRGAGLTLSTVLPSIRNHSWASSARVKGRVSKGELHDHHQNGQIRCNSERSRL